MVLRISIGHDLENMNRQFLWIQTDKVPVVLPPVDIAAQQVFHPVGAARRQSQRRRRQSDPGGLRMKRVTPHIPHLHTAGFVVYTGTHDNNTTRGWYESELDDPASRRLAAYAGNGVHAGNVHRVLARLAFASVARTAILPLQDLLGLDRGGRMNTPATGTGNWQWRLLPGQLTTRAERELLKLTRRYGRA